MKNVNYGVDAPDVIRNLAIAGIIGLVIPNFFPVVTLGSTQINLEGFITTGFFCSITAILMYLYGKFGKFKHRDRMLNMVNWRGDEQVLDIGTGRGLLMIGAAKRLTTGKSVGIDIWNKEDLSGNSVENALENANIEGVREKIEIKNENILTTSFADNHFDVILSNLCLHNIYNAEGRQQACVEIARILKANGGIALISDFRHTGKYATYFKELGLKTEMSSYSWYTFPLLRIVKVYK
jgi:arsenite methyltransferase